MNSRISEVVLAAVILVVVVSAFAQTWTQTSAPGAVGPEAFAMSADGRKAVAVSSGGQPIFSVDSGKTWQTNLTSPAAYDCIALSADGTQEALVCWSNFTISISTNSGLDWAQTGSPQSYQWWSLACSADGHTLIGAIRDSGGLIYVSTNSGSTWAAGGSPGKSWASVACSADGTRIVAAANGDKIYTSTNWGMTWTATAAASAGWLSVACSADGEKLIASGNATYISANFGVNWTLVNTNSGPVASSADGTRLAIGSGSIYTSSDSGASWVSNSAPVTSAPQFSWIACSADGCRMFARRFGSPGIWTCQIASAPTLKIRSSTGSEALVSWLVPSTNFVLQQSADLTAPGWVTLTNVPTLNLTNLQEEILLAPPNPGSFFRLTAQ